ncbi:hypothetical protein LXL04_007133 [Taraxacum kok-saghyz]
MGRRKLEIKRIEDKSSRRVAFSKRRAGLIKKARHLSVVCDVDVAVLVFSATGKLYEYCSGGSNSVEHILSKQQGSSLESEENSIEGASKDLKCTPFRTCKELLQSVDRLVEENNTEEMSVAVTDMTQLEKELHDALMQTRSIKTELMTKYLSTLQAEERKLSEEKEELKQQVINLLITVNVVTGNYNGGDVKVDLQLQVATTNKKDDGDDGGGDLDDSATNHNHKHPTNQQLFTLPLFKD